MLVENLLDKPQPCPSNSNRHLKGDDEGVRKQRKCQGVRCNNKTVSTCISCQKPSCGPQDNFRVTYVKCLTCAKLTGKIVLYFAQNVLFKSKIISLCITTAIQHASSSETSARKA